MKIIKTIKNKELFTAIGTKYLDPSGENNDKNSSANKSQSDKPEKINSGTSELNSKVFKLESPKNEKGKKKEPCAC